MTRYVLGLADLDHTKRALAGGKGANLGELSRISGIRVPDGVCVTTEAFARVVGGIPSLPDRLEALSRVGAGSRDELRARSAEIRTSIEDAAIPGELRDEIARAVVALGAHHAYAVRSSATAEDLPTASFAGQQDTYLNVIGVDAIVAHVRRCWASLFTERAVAYRARRGFDPRGVRLAVVVQQMIEPAVSGVLFTADPVSSNRTVSSIDACLGLGEALVSGRVTPDVYRVRAGAIVDRRIAAKSVAVVARAGGGTEPRPVAPERQHEPALTDAQIVALAQLGRTLEAHFGRPQDLEWCLADGVFYVVQSRPITTLFPIPEPRDGSNRVYISVGHQQMMLDAMRPLGRSLFQLTAMAPMLQAAGRLFVDVTPGLTSPGRDNLLNVLGGDPLIRSALVALIERGDFLPAASASAPPPRMIRSHHGLSAAEIAAPVAGEPDLVATLVAERERSLARLQDRMPRARGPEVFDLVLEDLGEQKRLLAEPRSMAAIMAGLHAPAWINEHVGAWLGEPNVADTIARSLPPNITSEMGLAVLDLADAIRPYPAVVAYLQAVTGDDFLDGLAALDGGRQARDAFAAFLAKYGMRCAGEIDITRDRWAERPRTLLPLLLGNVAHAAPGAGRRSFDQRRAEARAATVALVERVRQLPDGERKASETAQMIELIRAFMGYREYPKYHLVARYLVYKQALRREADALVQAGVIATREDIYYLTFHELQDGVRTQRIDPAQVARRRAEHREFEQLSPPRVITSDGEILTGAYARDHLPAGALPGLAVSSGVVEGRARIVRAIEDAVIEDGDILVTPFTDPSWTPLFVSIRGLVTEAGGLMTHGAVIAREYGLPAVVGVEHATQRIRDGQRIRVNGTEGFVEILSA